MSIATEHKLAASHHPQTLQMEQRARACIPGLTQLLSKRPDRFAPGQWPSYFQKAKGVTVWDLDGNSYIDMSISGVGAAVLGYADEEVGTAVAEAIHSGVSCSLNCSEEVLLAELLCELHPWARMVRFARTGGEAMAIAVRIARAQTGRDRIAFCGYHGWHDWYLAANLHQSDALGEHLLSGLSPTGVPKGLAGTALPFKYNRTDELHGILQKHPGEVAAIVMEPIRSDQPEAGFLDDVRQLADDHGCLLVVDEISAGFRLRTGGAHLELGLQPDIAVFAKAMSNGYAMAAIVGTADAMDAAEISFISSTYWTERIGPVAALATIEKHRRLNLGPQLVATGTKIQDGWRELAQRHQLPVMVGGIAPLAHFQFDHPQANSLKSLFVQGMLARGYLASTQFYAMAAHQEEHIRGYLAAADEVFSEIAGLLRGTSSVVIGERDARCIWIQTHRLTLLVRTRHQNRVPTSVDMLTPLLIRADASPEIGSGHVMRCRAVAHAWQDAGGACALVTVKPSSWLREMLKRDGIELVEIDAAPGSALDARQTRTASAEFGAGHVVLDGYHFSPEYQAELRSGEVRGRTSAARSDERLRLLMIDDEAKSPQMAADLVLNQNLGFTPADYQVDDSVDGDQTQPELLLGPEFALLRREFRMAIDNKPLANDGDASSATKHGNPQRILISFGGSDPPGATGRVMRAIQRIACPVAEVRVLAGNANPRYDELVQLAATAATNFRVLRHVDDMPGQLAWADVAIGAAGSSCWERAAFGLPSLLIELAENQRAIGQHLQEIHAAVFLGSIKTLDQERLGLAIEEFLQTSDRHAAMQAVSRQLVDGHGAVRVVQRLSQRTHNSQYKNSIIRAPLPARPAMTP